MKVQSVDWEKYAFLARKVAAEGCVLIKNENQVLPLEENQKIAVFGVNAFHYYKSGLGSGGLVNTKYVVSILDALKEENLVLDEELLSIYEKWIEENPFDEGHGWGTVPWSQKEMPVTKELVEKAASRSTTAIILIGRTAGEDQDNSDTPGSYRLTDVEENMLAMVTKQFEKTVLLFNVGNIMDMSCVAKYHPSAVMYVWQGGQEGGHGVSDLLMGRVTPSGKLSDTIAYEIKDYPSNLYFGDEVNNVYSEDIFVGYRYFETFAKEKVCYPFGYGLSYTTFTIEGKLLHVTKNDFTVEARVKNTGSYSGKEVVQVYVNLPAGKLSKPARVLAGFVKTHTLKPGEEQVLQIVCHKNTYASFDDTGVTGDPFSFQLEAGEYEIYVGNSVRDVTLCGKINEERRILQLCKSSCGPVVAMERMTNGENGELVMEQVNPSIDTLPNRIKKRKKTELAYTGNKGYVLQDVFEKKISMEHFLAQLSDEELACIARGEGMCSRKVTAGTAGAFGGVTNTLQEYGIPAACCADGPSGIRMDCGSIAFSLPNGTLIGCSFNLPLAEELFDMMGREIAYNKVDTILGPGMNIHRHPLNGRNFEYYSEDPFLTGSFAVAMLHGLHKSHVTGTLKHFVANNQEKARSKVNAVISEKALREIYLKGFEMAVKEGNARSVMTTYGSVNGLFTAGNYDLCTTILREEWGFDGIVMTDWWALANLRGEEPTKDNRASMVLAQNDLYMVCADTRKENELDNILKELKKGTIARGDLLRNAANICSFMMKSQAFLRQIGVLENSTIDEDRAKEAELTGAKAQIFYTMNKETDEVTIDLREYEKDGTGTVMFGINSHRNGEGEITLTLKSDTQELSQIPVSVFMDNIYRCTLSFRGTGGKEVSLSDTIGYAIGDTHFVKLQYKETDADLVKVSIRIQK